MNTKQHTIETVPEAGEVMLLAFHQNKQMWRPVIYVGPAHEPNNASQLFVGDWKTSLRKAQISGLNQYFDLYEKRYGAKHPEDPKRSQLDRPLPFNVITMRDGDTESYSHARTDH